jgi:DMSO/TMAO reductase YedYZ molybdopterin-dependent catalytic subunit
MTTRGFTGHRRGGEGAGRIPPGQHLTDDFPVLTAGPTQHISTAAWNFTLKVGPKPIKAWNWDAFNALPQTSVTRDIHCVTTWSKLDTHWQGVMFDDILADAGIQPPTAFSLAHSSDGYSANVPVPDLVDGKAMVALKYNDQPITPDHGGPARLLVPHLYFWKSAKYINGIQFIPKDEAGFWELRGYHMYGDPWREQRFTGD